MRRSVLFCYTGFLIAAFSYMSAAQTSLNSISVIKSDSSSKRAVEPETLGVSHPTKVKVAPLMQSKLVEARQLAETGATSFFVGIGIEYLLVAPLTIVGATNNNPGLIIGAFVAELVALGFKISGPIRNGVGASEAYDYGIQNGMAIEKNTNWTYYGVGWGFSAGSAILSDANNFSAKPTVGLSLVALTLEFAADAFWLTSCLNSLSYTKEISNKVGLVSLGVEPIYCAETRSYGLQITGKY